MNRRNLIRTLPFLYTGISSLPETVFSTEADSKPLCLEYLSRIMGIFNKIRSTELDNMLEASYNIARVYKNGGNCFCQWETGHSFDADMFPERQGKTDIFTMGYTIGSPGVEPKAGDLLLVSVIRNPLDDPREKGIFVIGGPTPWCGDTANPELLTERNRNLKIKMYSDIWIESYISTLGGLLWLPGETAPLGPTSGVLGMITYWPLIADAVRILARDGIFVKVSGDEPKLGENAPFVSLNQPLGGKYIEECTSQIGQIEAELGTIKNIANAVVDCILSGGKLYVYSRCREALSAEASAKRSGLALINTTWAEDKNFKGTKNDFMIMGVYQPDDEVDRKMFENYRKAGMKIATIGAATRNKRIPDGKTVTGDADFHLGNMCDTYGIFAVPGVERKVCPTSGLLMNVMFWATAIEIAEEIMRRTGDTPCVLSTGAVIGGGDQRTKRTELAKMRGY